MTCQEVHEALAAGEGGPASREHLAICPACREAERAFSSLRDRLQAERRPPPEAATRRVLALAFPRRHLSWRAVAAVLLLAAGLALLPRRSPPPSVSLPGPLPVAASAYPRTLGSSGGVTVDAVEEGVAWMASAGSRLELLASGRARMERGRVLVQAFQHPVTLETPFGTCVASDACFEFSCVPVRTLLSGTFLDAACAGEAGGAWELLVERGEVRWEGRRIPAPCLMREKSSGPQPLDAASLAVRRAWRDGEASWQDLLGKDTVPLRLVSGGGIQAVRRELLSCKRFIWSATLSRKGGGYLEILLPHAVSGSETLTLGELAQLGDGREHTLTLRWDLTPSLLLDGVVLKEFPRLPAGNPVAGLGVTNGTLEVRAWHWRPLP